MSRSRAKSARALLLAATALLVAFPASGEKKPQSLLPPGFNQPTPTPPETPAKPDTPSPERKPTDLLDELKLKPPAEGADNASAGSGASAKRAAQGNDDIPADTDALGNAVAAVDDNEAPKPAPYEIPPEARRTLAHIGVIDPASGGVDAQAFGHVDGRVLEQAMRQISAPFASRWVSIVLRRVLLSDVQTPARVNGADWVAERAWLLLRMGEADPARMLVHRVDNDNFTPKLLSVAMQSALANADIAAVCPLTARGIQTSDAPSWEFARAMCASLSGEAASASSLLREAESDTDVRGFDARLAERVIGAGKNARHAVVIDWGDVSHLSAWRFGTSTAVGLKIPDTLYGTVRPNVRAWAARAPMLSFADRRDDADWAAALGVFSSDALVDFYSAIADQSEARQGDSSPQTLLATAYTAPTPEARTAALAQLWTQPGLDPVHQYARLILTARAALRVPADRASAKYADALTAAMMTAGLDIQASRWARLANDGTDDATLRTWGLLAVGAPKSVVDITERRMGAYRAEGDLRSRFLVAALIGLNRVEPGQAGRIAGDYNIVLDQKSSWARAIDAAAARGEKGTVALLAAQGVQGSSWANVTPENLFHIVAAFRRVGFEPEARMIAAEALTRA